MEAAGDGLEAAGDGLRSEKECDDTGCFFGCPLENMWGRDSDQEGIDRLQIRCRTLK